MRKALTLCLLLLGPSYQCAAMEFAITDPTFQSFPTVVGKGAIVEGDAARLTRALLNVPRDSWGFKWLALDSPGGLVSAAFESAKVISSFGVVTIVPPGFSCASACAAIMFGAGKYRRVLRGGALGLHTCYDKGPRTNKKNDLCNEQIAQFAVEHGTDWGSVHNFMAAAGPDDMIWFSSEMADCFGLSRYPAAEEPANYKQCIYRALRDVACTSHGKCQ